MSVSIDFQENVQSGDLITVRSALLDYLIVDCSFKLFDEALLFASNVLPIIDEFDKGEIESDSSKWDKNYLNKQKVALMVNFSKERVKHIKAVIEKVLPNAVTPIGDQGGGVTSSIPDSLSLNSRKLTGYTVISEVEVPVSTKRPESGSSVKPRSSKCQTPAKSKTGRYVIAEEEIISQSKPERNSESFDYGMALFASGGVVTLLGVVLVKPVVIGAGIVIIGAGSALKMKK